MNSLIVGVGVMLALIGLQFGARHIQFLRANRLWARANECIQGDNFDEAEKILRKCVKLMPLLLPARIGLGSVLARLGRLTEAEEQFKAVVTLEPRQPEGYLHLGFFYVTQFQDRDADAVASLCKAVEYNAELREKIWNDPRLLRLRGNAQFMECFANTASH
ncbi:MAG TPA: tetratricopeptide repeat protein [Candidatus Hydrogenedentes bacterium]|nr:tetratricopeptide repeat protein [Candidatus Hydrogenedentota bacterium]